MRTIRTSGFFLALLMGLFWLNGCTPVAPEKGAKPTAGAVSQPSVARIPDLLSDGELDFAAYTNQVRLVDFWATWCLPCRSEMPTLNKLQSEYADKGFRIIGLSVDRGDRSKLSRIVKGLKPGYPVGLADEALQNQYGGIRAVPTKFLLDRSGRVVKRYEGVVPEKLLRRDIEALL